MKKLGVLAVIAVLVIVAVAAGVPYGPTVVSKVSLLNQTSSVAYTTFNTPSSDRDYLVLIYTVCSDASTSNTTSVAYTDEFGTSSISATNSAGGPPGRTALPIHAVSGQPIQYKTTFSSSDSGYCDSYISLVAH